MKSFVVPPWGQRVHVTDNLARFVSRYNRHATDNFTQSDYGGAVGLAVKVDTAKGPLFMLYLSRGCCAGTLHHEALHMAHFIMEYAGAGISIETTETQAYTMEYIAQQAGTKLGISGGSP